MIYSLVFSFHEADLSVPGFWGPFIGAGNYGALVQDARFWNSAMNTLLFMVGSVTIEFPLGLGIALLLNQQPRGHTFFRNAILFPMMLSPMVAGYAWKMLYDQRYGLIDYYLTTSGLGSVPWLSDMTWVKLAVIIVDVWQWTPFVALILLAGLQSLPVEPCEAAKIDGASNLQMFRYVSLPMIKPAIVVSLLIRIVDTFKIFDMVFILTQGGPGVATETMTMYDYFAALRYTRMGYGAAMSYVMLIIATVMIVFTLRSITRSEVKPAR